MKNLNIPNLFPIRLEDKPNKLSPDKKSLRVPLINMIFSDSATSVKDNLLEVKKMIEGVKEFYLENSYGKFFFDIKLATVRLDHPKNWKGNAPIAPDYDEQGNLQNKQDFPEEVNYTGYHGFIVALKRKPNGDPQTYFRNYNAIAERNYCEDALKKLEILGGALLQDWLNFGIPLGESRATICFVSEDMRSGGSREFGTWIGEGHNEGDNWPSRSLPITIGGRKLIDYLYSELNWRTLAHELGHKLGFPDLYYREGEGYLGDITLMSNHWKGSHLDALLKLRMGWISPTVVVPKKGVEKITLNQIYRSAENSLLIYPDSIGHPDEFFLVEVRSKNGMTWENVPAKFDLELSADQEGVFIYHVNTENQEKTKPRIDLEGDSVVSGTNLVVFNAISRKSFSSSASKFYDGSKSGLNLKVIREHERAFDLEIFWNYDRGISEIDILDNQNNLKRLNSYNNWRKTWDIILAGNFGGSSFTDLFFYDKSAGEAQFFTTDGAGRINQIGQTHTGWRKSWDKMLPGNFGGSSHTDLLFYDKAAGEAQFFATNGLGGMNSLGSLHKGWRKTWQIMLPGNFGGSSHTDLLFYDRAAGEAQFFITDGRGGMKPIGALHKGWRKTWDTIVPGNFGGSSHTDLLFYDKAAGEGQFFITDGRGGMNPIGSLHKGWRKTWDLIVTFQLSSAKKSGILFYDKNDGCIEIHESNGRGDMVRISRTYGIRGRWDQILAGNFSSNSSREEFLFYDRGN